MLLVMLPASGTRRPHLSYSNGPPQMHLFQMKCYASRDKPRTKVSSIWGILSLRHCGSSLWTQIWGVFLPSGGKGVPQERVPPMCATRWSALCFPHLPGLLSGALGPPLFTPRGLLAPLIAPPQICLRGHPPVFGLCWPQSLSLRLMSGAAFGLEIVNYSGKGLNPGRSEEECLKELTVVQGV